MTTVSDDRECPCAEYGGCADAGGCEGECGCGVHDEFAARSLVRGPAAAVSGESEGQR